MVKYIDKDALVAEIEKRINFNKNLNLIERTDECNAILSFLDTLEVKEVDLDKEVEKSLKRHSMLAVGKKDFTDIAKHFFELGLNARNPLTWEDVKEICVQSVLVEIDLGRKVSDEIHYTEVLKRFKAHNGDKI